MQIFVCKRRYLLYSICNKARQPKLTTGAVNCGPLVQKAVRVMKLIAFFILAACLHVNATGYGQKVTLSEREVHIEKIFTEIKKQTGFTFLYTSNILANTKRVSVKVTNASVNEVLDLALAGQGLEYRIKGEDRLIIIKLTGSKTGKITGAGLLINLNKDIRGKVIDESGRPIAGVTVAVKGTKTQTLTDENGEFNLSNVSDNAVLTFSSVNMETFEVNVSGQKEIIAKLKTKTSELDEVQIIAYGQTTKRFQTGNVATVKGEDIQKQPTSNPLLALEGRVPGLFITQANGIPGGGVTVRIQGENSISGAVGKDPLYVIDGVPYAAQLLPNLAGVLGNSGGPIINGIASGGGSAMNYINPGDIESIEVLKDADATAIYGSRAANGAILITTKKGKTGQTSVDINMQGGYGKITRKMNLLNTSQYLKMRNEAIQNDGGVADPGLDYDLLLWDTTRFTDWQNELLGNTSRYTDVQANVTGGNALTQILVGAGYHKETTVFPGDFFDERGSLHFSLTNVSSNQKFKIQLSGNYLAGNNRMPQTDLSSVAIQLAPNAPTLYNADGSLNWMPTSGISTWDNPLAVLYQPYKNKTTNIINSANLSYKILTGLEIRGNFGLTDIRTRDVSITPLVSLKPEDQPNSSRSAGYGYSNNVSWIVEPQLSYKRSFGKGMFDLLAGATIQESRSNFEQFYGVGYNSDDVLEDIQSASSIGIINTGAATYKYSALFGRLNYNWHSKYTINLTSRRDGSSRFGEQNQFHNFYAVGTAWIFTKEKFIQQALPILSFGKLRGSYGTTGNDQIGDYQFLNLYSPINVDAPYQNTNGLQARGLSNPYLEWEETKKLQLGIDLGFFTDRVLVTANYVRNRSNNQLLGYSLPMVTGIGFITSNLPATVQNSAWEFSFNSENIKSSKFSWSSSFNLTIPRNKLISFPNLESSAYKGRLFIGESISVIKVYQFVGVNQATGIYEFLDKGGNIVSKPNFENDRTIFVNTLPRLYGGIHNSFSYKGIRLEFLLQFVKQLGNNYIFGSSFGASFNTNQPTTWLDRWQKPGDNTTIQKYNSDFSLYNQLSSAKSSDAAYSDASYIRLKMLSLSWQIPEVIRKKMTLKNCTLYIHGQNLFTVTNYKGMDPENRISTALPPLKVVTFGLQIGI